MKAGEYRLSAEGAETLELWLYRCLFILFGQGPLAQVLQAAVMGHEVGPIRRLQQGRGIVVQFGVAIQDGAVLTPVAGQQLGTGGSMWSLHDNLLQMGCNAVIGD